MVGATEREVNGWLAELGDAGVFSRGEAGQIYSRRMVRDEHIRAVRAAAGKLGGNPELVGRKDKQNPTTGDKQEVTPSFSVSVSSSGNLSPSLREGVSLASPTTGPAAKLLGCPHAELIAVWHQVMPELPAVQSARWPGSASETNLRKRWREGLVARSGWWRFETREQGIVKFTELLEICRDSDFLMGRVSQPQREPFRLNLHWLLRRTNFDKVLSNNYHQDRREAA
jgi:hypothetical protein